MQWYHFSALSCRPLHQKWLWPEFMHLHFGSTYNDRFYETIYLVATLDFIKTPIKTLKPFRKYATHRIVKGFMYGWNSQALQGATGFTCYSDTPLFRHPSIRHTAILTPRNSNTNFRIRVCFWFFLNIRSTPKCVSSLSWLLSQPCEHTCSHWKSIECKSNNAYCLHGIDKTLNHIIITL